MELAKNLNNSYSFIGNMTLEKLVFDLKGTKVLVSTEVEGKSPIYQVGVCVKTHDSEICSYIDYDTDNGVFLDKPDGIQILGLSFGDESGFLNELNEIYLVLALRGYVLFKEKKY